MKRLLLASLLLMAGGCINPLSEEFPSEAEGYIPVYGAADAGEIRMKTPQSIHHPGKIYLYQHYLLINERNRGIHIFDNSDPAAPVAVGFIEITGNSDMAVRDGVLYADHLGSLVALDASSFQALRELGRLPISNWHLGVPPPRHAYFECVDAEKGIVVSWKKQVVKNPQCYAP